MQSPIIHTVTEKTLELLRERRVYHRQNQGDRWKVGDRIAVPATMALEPYCSIYRSNLLPVSLGAFSYVQGELATHVSIGRYCSIGSATWMGDEHPMDWATTSSVFYGPQFHRGVMAFFQEDNPGRRLGVQRFDGAPKPITIGNDVWIGDQAMIKGGVTIGDGAVIGARSTITKDVPPYAVVVGTPGRVMRSRFDSRTVARLLALKWWRFAPDQIALMDVAKPEAFLDRFEAWAASDEAQEMVLQPLLAEEISAT